MSKRKWASLRELIERHAGGVRGGWDNLLAVIPGGSSTPCLPATICDKGADGFRQPGRREESGLGTAALIVMDKSTDIVRAIARLSQFYKHESCGQCTPCREGLGWVCGSWSGWSPATPRSPSSTCCTTVTKETRATRSVRWPTAPLPVAGLIRHFRPEMERRIEQYRAAAGKASGRVGVLQ